MADFQPPADNSLDGTPLAPGGGSDTLPLRITAIFVVLVASLLGSLLPIFCNLNPKGSALRLLKSFAAGTILGLAWIHVGTDSFDTFSNLQTFDQIPEQVSSYPWGALSALVAIMCMAVVENCLCAHQHLRGNAHTHTVSGKHSHDLEATSHAHDHSHTHICVSGEKTVSWVDAATTTGTEKEKRRNIVSAYLMELGCVFHSVIIGIDLGTRKSDDTSGQTGLGAYITVICFHQLFEGIGLGSLLSCAQFSSDACRNRMKAVAMAIIYSLTTPVGIAIGIAIANTYDDATIKAIAVQGTFDGLSAGLLLYVGLVTMLSEEFTREDLLTKEMTATRFGMYVALFLGAGILAVIGIWT